MHLYFLNVYTLYYSSTFHCPFVLQAPSTTDRKQACQGGRHEPLPGLTMWGGSCTQILRSPDSAGNAERGRAERFSNPLPQTHSTEGLDSCLTDNHDKGFGQEVLGCARWSDAIVRALQITAWVPLICWCRQILPLISSYWSEQSSW